MTSQPPIDQSTSAPRLWVEFAGLGVFVLDRQKAALDLQLVDAEVARIVPHRPVLMAPFDRVRIGMGFEIPTVLTIGATRVAIWDLTGRDLTCSAPDAIAGVSFPDGPDWTDPRPKPIDSPTAWNNLHWLPDLNAACGATRIAHKELVAASASFTSGSMFVGVPPIGADVRFMFEGVPSVTPRLYSDRGGCICPMDPAGVTLTLTSRTDRSRSWKVGLVPDPGTDLHIAISNYAQHETMPMSTGQMLTEHFTAYYKLVDSKTQPALVPVDHTDAPSVRCVPPFLMI